MKYILAGLILMLPMSFIAGYLAGTLEDYLFEQGDDE